MKVVILCGGRGTRLSEETHLRPKPMVKIGSKPILYHIMKIYARHGHTDFVCALGYMGDFIKDYFHSFFTLHNDFSINLANGSIDYLKDAAVDWNVSLIDTGDESMTGGRLHRLESHVRDSGTFMLTYGDGVANVNITELVAFHKSHGKIATVCGVRPPVRFGEMIVDQSRVTQFVEKPQAQAGWINGGFFVFEPEIFDYLDGDSTILERAPMERLVADKQLMSYSHHGFWQCMDTIRDKEFLNDLVANGKAPWLE